MKKIMLLSIRYPVGITTAEERVLPFSALLFYGRNKDCFMQLKEHRVDNLPVAPS